nr:NusG domain II-containing protein [uncultured Catonella sp.]
MDKNKRKRKHDIILGIILLSVASILFVIDLTNASSDTVNKNVVVSVDGKKIAEYPLKKDATYKLSGSHLGTNTLVIKSGKAYISEANCPDKQCMKQGKIERAGEMLVCLPNRVVIKIVDDEKEPVIDGVSG